jgi:hypothetical protein
MKMATLKSLSFVAMPKVETNPTMIRRKEVVARLELQKNLALDAKFVRTIKTKDGEKTQKVRPSWVENPDGSCFFVLRVGFAPVEFQKGATAIRVKSRAELPDTIDTLVAAIQAGELDDKIMPAKKAGGSKRNKAA